MRQTLALLIDAYRDLNSRKLFWITLIISGFVIIAFALIGVDGDAITFAGMRFEMHGVVDPLLVYKEAILSTAVVGVWLTWGAIVLALISTAGLFPDLMSSGAIDLYLSKPISRTRLFVTKYLTGLLFVGLQVSVFIFGCFLVMGWRAHDWRPALFIAIPLVMAMFSYLFAFSVLLGVWTRSTVAAILLTVLFWLVFSLVQRTEPSLLFLQALKEQERMSAERQLARYPTPENKEAVDVATHDEKRIHMFHSLFYGVELIIPKTTATTNLFDRYLLTKEELNAAKSDQQTQDVNNNGPGMFGASRQEVNAATPAVQRALLSRTPFTIIGSSLLCELVVLLVAGWLFCRRDY